MQMKYGSVIFLNGTSGSGKSSLAKELQNQLDEPFWHVSSDQFINAKLLPLRDFEGGKFAWASMRPHFFEAFHSCLPAIAKSGNNLIVDHIIEEVTWLEKLQENLKDLDVFFVGVYCDLLELEKREKQRLAENPAIKRFVGESQEHLHTHSFCEYDFEVDTTNISVVENCSKIIQAWKNRKGDSLFFK